MKWIEIIHLYLLFSSLQEQRVSAVLLTTLGCLGVLANLSLMLVIAIKQPLTRWSQGLIFHQAVVDGARAAILLPLGRSIFLCQAISKCSLVETTFLLLVTVSTVNLLTTVLNATPVVPSDLEEADHDTLEMVRDNPQCVAFGLFMIWFSSITINLGPTFLSGALAANADDHINEPSCPLVQGPYRHYILNVLWIMINMLCMLLIIKQLHRLHKEFSHKNVKVSSVKSGYSSDGRARLVSYLASRVGKEGASKVRIFFAISFSYILFWGPLFTVTLVNWNWEWKDAKNSLSHEVTLHIAFVHSFVNPLLFIILHRNTRDATCNLLMCHSMATTPSDEDKMSDGGRCETMVTNETPHAGVEVHRLESNNHGNTGVVGNHVHYAKYRHSKVVQL